MAKSRRVATFYSRAASAFFLAAPLLLGLSPATVNAACATCDNVADLLKPCNTGLDILTWPGKMVYQ
jgi:hypothetical protein